MSDFKVLEQGCDYIVATVQREEGRWQEVTNNWADIMHAARRYSGLVEDAALLGYAGLLSGKVFWGFRYDGSLFRATGSDAKAYWPMWERASGKPTRLDFQFTVRCGDNWPELLRTVFEQASAASRLLPPERQRKVRVQTDLEEGHTVYVGARTTGMMGRVYHKWPTDRDRYEYGDVRFEVELRGKHAALAYESYFQSEMEIGQWALGYVVDWYEKRGVSLAGIDAIAVNSRFTDVLDPNPLDKKLDWLYNQVGPTVRLMADQGHTAEVFRVLFGPQWLEYLLGRLTAEGGMDNAEES